MYVDQKRMRRLRYRKWQPTQKDQASVPEDKRSVDCGDEFRAGNPGAVYPSQCWTSDDQNTVGIISAKLNQNLSRNMATEWPAWRSCCRRSCCIVVTILRVAQPQRQFPGAQLAEYNRNVADTTTPRVCFGRFIQIAGQLSRNGVSEIAYAMSV